MSELNIVCLDLEGVLVPEIWIAFSEASGIPELRRTTRDEPDYDKLMKWRLGILKEHGLKLADIQNTIAKIDPLEAQRSFWTSSVGSLRSSSSATPLPSLPPLSWRSWACPPSSAMSLSWQRTGR